METDLINFLLPKLEHIGLLGYWVVLLIALLESLAFVGLVVPGTTLILIIGFMAAQGWLDFGDLIWFAAVGAIIGDVISFYLGKYSIGKFKWQGKIFSKKNLEKGEKFFEQYGYSSVFLARFFGPLRPVVPFVAGMFKMRPRSFVFLNVVSAFAWAVVYLSVGYLFGHIISGHFAWFKRAEFGVLVLIILIVGIYFWRKYKIGQSNIKK